METEKAHSELQKAWLKEERLVKEIQELKHANHILTAELFERAERIKVAEELVSGILNKSVDKYLQNLSPVDYSR